MLQIGAFFSGVSMELYAMIDWKKGLELLNVKALNFYDFWEPCKCCNAIRRRHRCL